MKFLDFLHPECGPRLGALLGDAQVLDLTATWPAQPAPASVDDLIAGGEATVDLARQCIVAAGGKPAGTLPFAAVTILPLVATTGRNSQAALSRRLRLARGQDRF